MNVAFDGHDPHEDPGSFDEEHAECAFAQPSVAPPARTTSAAKAATA